MTTIRSIIRKLARALRWLVDRLARPVVIVTLIVLCWAVVAGYHLLWDYEPQAAWTLTTLAVGFACGLTYRDRRLKALAVVSEWHDEEIGAIKLADTIADKELLTPDPAPIETVTDLLVLNTERSWRLRDREVELYDQDAPAREMKVLGEEDAPWCGCGLVMEWVPCEDPRADGGWWQCPAGDDCADMPENHASTYGRRLS